jgi:hypothetical protein
VPKKVSNKRFEPIDKAVKTSSNWNPHPQRVPSKTAGHLGVDLINTNQQQSNFD